MRIAEEHIPIRKSVKVSVCVSCINTTAHGYKVRQVDHLIGQ